MKKLTIITIVCLVLLVGFAVTVTAVSGNSLTYLLDRAGDKLGTLIFGQMDDQIVSVEPVTSIGAAQSAGVTQGTAKVAIISTDHSTTTIGSILNDSNQDRTITGFVSWYQASQNNTLPTTGIINLQVSTSSDAFTTSTTMFLFNGDYPTSTGALGVFFISSTTPKGMTNDAARIWEAGEYLNFNIAPTNTHSTSTGYIGVEYIVK